MATTSSVSTTTGSTSSSTGSGGAGGASGSTGSVTPRCTKGLCDTSNDGALCSFHEGVGVAPGAAVLICGALVLGFLRRHTR